MAWHHCKRGSKIMPLRTSSILYGVSLVVTAFGTHKEKDTAISFVMIRSRESNFFCLNRRHPRIILCMVGWIWCRSQVQFAKDGIQPKRNCTSESEADGAQKMIFCLSFNINMRNWRLWIARRWCWWHQLLWLYWKISYSHHDAFWWSKPKINTDHRQCIHPPCSTGSRFGRQRWLFAVVLTSIQSWYEPNWRSFQPSEPRTAEECNCLSIMLNPRFVIYSAFMEVKAADCAACVC